ncbi:O-antigen ligase family protein [Rhizobium tubonense]|uniref:O-antigen ligase-related domain-containing protein n=1 Tax=Rhizobium tubonense TaxID=484088 RepID=A0A2W4CXR2_9HYPH|nr:O-antigen ligase family protein [Rhizobium tubonense]PZM15568.1 hypothetical protein CPY51_07010 [Rhizobium tubonense]
MKLSTKKTNFESLSATAIGQSERLVRLIEVLFFIFLLVVLVRVSMGESDSVDARFARLDATEAGDRVKQAAYTLAFITFLGLWIRLRGLRLPSCISLMQVLLIGWIILSTTWAYDPNVSFRRAVLLVFVFASIAISVDFLGPTRSLDVMYKALAACMTASLISVFLFPSFAIHPPTEVDQSIVGGWKGVFIHKNTAGAVCAMATIIFLHYGMARRRWYDWFFLAICVVFLVGCKAKTPLGLLLLVVPAGFLYRAAWHSALGRLLVLLFISSSAALVAVGVSGYSDKLAELFSNPQSFTGRVAIWDTALAFSADHPWLGSGYSSLWAVSSAPPILPYMTDAFLEAIVHSHNGYLEMLATTGIPGLTLALVAALVVPLFQFLFAPRANDIKFFSLLFSLWFFGLLENLMETQLYTRDREVWIVFVTTILIVQIKSKYFLDRRYIVTRRNAEISPQNNV